MGEKVDRLILAAQKLAEQQSDFFKTKGPGPRDHAANEYMRNLRKVAESIFGKDHSETKVRADLDFKFDFYFPEEATVVEIALSFDKPMTEIGKTFSSASWLKKPAKRWRNWFSFQSPVEKPGKQLLGKRRSVNLSSKSLA